MKRITLSVILIIAIFVSCLGFYFINNNSTKISENAEEVVQESLTAQNLNDIKKLTDISSVKNIASNKFSLSADGAVLYCANNADVIYGKNQNKKMKIASTTKVMTAILTLEAASADNKTITFTKEMIAEGSSMYLKVGDKLKLTDLAVGMMLASGNDAANAAAISISGSIEEFAKLMNKRAEQIGMKNTNFVTPSGLDDENHYSTAYDMALLLSYAMENKEFAQITASKSSKVKFESPEGQTYTYTNHNKLLSRYENCIGGKTGFTKAAGRCLVSVAEKDGLRLISVTIKASDDWNDHISMFKFGFENLSVIKCDDTDEEFKAAVVGADLDFTTLICKDSKDFVIPSNTKYNLERIVYLPNFLYAPIKTNETAGKIIYKIDGNIVFENKLITPVEISYLKKE